MPLLKLPTALAFTVLGAAVAASCGKDAVPPVVDASCVPCVYEGSDNGNCPPTTCATGPDSDVCPQGCIPAPVG
jgi:hypothetical protein